MRGAWWTVTLAALVVAGCDSSGGAADDAGTIDDGGSDGGTDGGVDGTSDGGSDAGGDGGVDGSDGGTDSGPAPDAVDPADGMAVYDVAGAPAPPTIDVSGFPKDPSGRPILLKGGWGEALVLETITPPAGAAISWGPLNDFAGCQKRLLACVGYYKKGSLDACMSGSHCIGTQKPSDGPGCCPTTCWNAYVDLRAKGVKDTDAAYRVFFKSPRCVAGLDDALGGRK